MRTDSGSRTAPPVSLAPGATLTLSGPDEAILIASGLIATPDGFQLGRGTLVGPADGELSAVADRPDVRLFSLPVVSAAAAIALGRRRAADPMSPKSLAHLGVEGRLLRWGGLCSGMMTGGTCRCVG